MSDRPAYIHHCNFPTTEPGADDRVVLEGVRDEVHQAEEQHQGSAHDAAALRAGLDRPDRAAGVVLAHSLGGLKHPELAELVKADRAAAVQLPVLDRLLTPAFRAEHPDWAFLFQQMGTFNTAKMADLRNLGSAGPSLDELNAAPFPVLVLAGEKDSVLSPATVRRAGELLPRAQVEIVPGAPHSMYWETPVLFNDALRRFLASVYETEAARS